MTQSVSQLWKVMKELDMVLIDCGIELRRQKINPSLGLDFELIERDRCRQDPLLMRDGMARLLWRARWINVMISHPNAPS